METKVVNVRKSEYDVYCGRPKGNEKFHYGNPFSHNPRSKAEIVVATREESIDACRRWLEGEAYQDVEPERRVWILEHLHELKGKILGCWCAPKSCHCDLYVELINKK
jgi:hypothetical protein